MSDIDWSELPAAALALARIVNRWRSHIANAQGARNRAAAIRAGGGSRPDGVPDEDWRRFPDLLDEQAAAWDRAVEEDASEFRQAVASVVAAGRLTRTQTAQFSAVASVEEADAAVTALKRELF